MPPHQHTALTRPALRGPARSSHPPQMAADAPRNTKKSVYIQPSVATRQSQVVVKSSAKKLTSAPQVAKPVPVLDAPGTADLLVAQLFNETPPLAAHPYLPQRFLGEPAYA